MANGERIYLVQATNELVGILLNSLEPPVIELARGLTVGCQAYSFVLEDGSFWEDLDMLIHLGQEEEVRQRFSSLAQNTEQFEQFLRMEEDLLIRAGFSRWVTRSIINKAREVRRVVRAPLEDVETVRIQVVNLHEIACNGAKRFGAIVAEIEMREQAKRRATKVAYGLCGLGLASFNAVAFASTIGLSAHLALWSGTLGAGLVGGAVAQASG
jgi:hypothetical protein